MIRHISWNVVTQVISFAVPVITLPLLIRRLGLSSYGNYTLALLLWQSMAIIMDYSFNTVGVQLFSKAPDKYQIFNEILSARIIIAIVCFTLLPILSIVFLKSFHIWFVFGGIIFIFGYFLNNNYWYYASEQFKLLAIVNLISRGSLIVSVVLLAFDTISSLYVQSASMLIGGIASLFLSKYYKYVRISKIRFAAGFGFISSSSQSFGANFVGYLLSNSPLFIGSFILNSNTYGVYALADRIVRVFLAIYGGAGQVIFRQAVSRASESRVVLRSFIRSALFKVVPIYTGFVISGIILIYFLQPFIFHGKDKINLEILVFLAFWSIISVFNGVIGFTYLQSVEKYQIYFSTMLLALCLTVLLICIFGRFGSGLGIAAALVLVELVIASICLYLFSFRRL